jgi:hypothetical protein
MGTVDKLMGCVLVVYLVGTSVVAWRQMRRADRATGEAARLYVQLWRYGNQIGQTGRERDKLADDLRRLRAAVSVGHGWTAVDDGLAAPGRRRADARRPRRAARPATRGRRSLRVSGAVARVDGRRCRLAARPTTHRRSSVRVAGWSA